MGVAFYRGGFADVWKGEHRGLEVAVKVLRFYRETDFQMIARVSHRWYLLLLHVC